MGRPDFEKPQFSEIDGSPYTLNGRVFRSMTSSLPRSCSGAACSSAKDGVMVGAVGVRTKSTSSNRSRDLPPLLQELTIRLDILNGGYVGAAADALQRFRIILTFLLR